jgi:NADH-quinone oxidoreductase subunit A
MTSLVITILVFLTVGAVFLAANLLAGKLVRPHKPGAEKAAAYECGEVPVGDARVQFDARFYVAALLFIVFDVEMAFLFPWAVVFGSTAQLADPAATDRIALVQQMDPTATVAPPAATAGAFAELAFLELLTFFGILLVGFAYIWHRGDLAWVTGTATATAEEP